MHAERHKVVCCNVVDQDGSGCLLIHKQVIRSSITLICVCVRVFVYVCMCVCVFVCERARAKQIQLMRPNVHKRKSRHFSDNLL